MGIGSKPFMDIKPSDAAISDRAIDYIMKGSGELFLHIFRLCFVIFFLSFSDSLPLSGFCIFIIQLVFVQPLNIQHSYIDKNTKTWFLITGVLRENGFACSLEGAPGTSVVMILESLTSLQYLEKYRNSISIFNIQIDLTRTYHKYHITIESLT